MLREVKDGIATIGRVLESIVAALQLSWDIGDCLFAFAKPIYSYLGVGSTGRQSPGTPTMSAFGSLLGISYGPTSSFLFCLNFS